MAETNVFNKSDFNGGTKNSLFLRRFDAPPFSSQRLWSRYS